VRTSTGGQRRQSSGCFRIIEKVERAKAIDLGVGPLKPTHNPGPGEHMAKVIGSTGNDAQSPGFLTLGTDSV
jgi:hypothetical protein